MKRCAPQFTAGAIQKLLSILCSTAARRVGIVQFIDGNHYLQSTGGVMVPLDEQYTILDLAAAMKLPTVVVARVKLGTINHTLLTVQAIRNAGLYMAGVVINGYSVPAANIVEETAPNIIAELGNTKILATVGQDEQSSVENLRLGQMILAGLGEYDWKSLVLAG